MGGHLHGWASCERWKALQENGLCEPVDLAMQGVHLTTGGFSARVAVRSWVQFDVSTEKEEEEGGICWKGVSPKRKKRQWKIFSLLPVRMAEPTGCVPERLHLFTRGAVGVATERLQS